MGDNLYEEVDPFLPIQPVEKDEKSIIKVEAINKALKKNISCLYKTAKLELERKDKEISKLKLRITELETQLQTIITTKRQEDFNNLMYSTAATTSLIGLTAPNYYYYNTLLNASQLCHDTILEDMREDVSSNNDCSSDRKRKRRKRSLSPYSSKNKSENGVKKPCCNRSNQSDHTSTSRTNYLTRKTTHNNTSNRTSQSSTKTNQSSTKTSQSSTKTSQSSTKTSTKTSHSSNRTSHSNNRTSHSSNRTSYLSTKTSHSSNRTSHSKSSHSSKRSSSHNHHSSSHSTTKTTTNSKGTHVNNSTNRGHTDTIRGSSRQRETRKVIQSKLSNSTGSSTDTSTSGSIKSPSSTEMNELSEQDSLTDEEKEEGQL